MSVPDTSKDYIVEPARKTPISARTGVLVAGGGLAGVAAALAAARNGADVLLIEAAGFLGGAGTAGMMGCFMGFDRKVIGGIGEEIISGMIQRGAAIEEYQSLYDPEALKALTFDKLLEAGVDLLLYTLAVEPIVVDDSVKGVIVENKSGRSSILADIIIDATGDGDVAARAGVPFEKGRASDGATQPITLVFRVGNIDNHKVIKFALENKEQFRSYDPPTGQGFLRPNLEPPQFALEGYFQTVNAARQKGEIELDQDIIYINSVPGRNEVIVNATQVVRADGTNASDLTRAELKSRRQVGQLMKFLHKYVPGFEQAVLIDTANRIGVRETRRILGEYVLTANDVIEGRRFADGIARNNFPIDIHAITENDKYVFDDRTFLSGVNYDIPYRCLVPRKVENLLIAGRCISATHEALASARSQPCCMLTGQAAGTAAALAASTRTRPRNIDVESIRRTLIYQGAKLA
jgi:glycine/D-amino acid oxidase-like deaminating enzyme